PGVPNRYRTKSSSREIRPKSIVTVVVDFPSTPATSSVMTLEEVSASSVCSGMISLTAPTSVVLPTPNPPATTIFTAVGKLERAESIDNRLENCVVGMVGGGGRRVDGDPPGGEQITQEHPQDADGEIEPGGQ